MYGILPRWLLLDVLGFFFLAGTMFPQSAQQPNKKVSPPSKPAQTAASPALEPKAIELLKATSDRLAAAHTLGFTAVETYESPSRQGHPLVFVNKSQVTLQRPDKLRLSRPATVPPPSSTTAARP